MIQFDEHIFQMGWFNHQLATLEPVNVLYFWPKGPSKTRSKVQSKQGFGFQDRTIGDGLKDFLNLYPATEMIQNLTCACFFETGGSTISYSQPGFNWVQSCSKFYMMSGSQKLIKVRRFVCDSWIFSPSIRSGMVLIVGVVWLGSFRGMTKLWHGGLRICL